MSIRSIVKLAKIILPKVVFVKLKALKLQFQYTIYYPLHYKSIVRKLRKKDKIKVAFFLIHESVWKYEGVYHLMEKDDRFEPIVVVCPYIVYGEETMLNDLRNAYNSFKEKGYNVVKTLNEETGVWLDVKKEIQPDIVFFTNPHHLTKEEYYITNFLDCLTCYVPYNFGNSHLYQMMHNQEFHNLLFLLFAETEMHKSFSVKYAINEGINVKVTGFPGTDILLDKNHKPLNPWKNKNDKLKKIIWAPHHTIDNDKSFLSYSSFLLYCDFIFELLNEFEDFIQIAFKPHPILKNKLYNESGWGKIKTDLYYEKWRKYDNCQLVEGDYIDLFLTSDAMIHDSGSFLIEYLYTGKPVLHTNRDDSLTERLNEFGILAFEQHYHATCKEDIKVFIENVINNIDNKKVERIEFLNSKLLPPNGESASVNVLNEICKVLMLA